MRFGLQPGSSLTLVLVVVGCQMVAESVRQCKSLRGASESLRLGWVYAPEVVQPALYLEGWQD